MSSSLFNGTILTRDIDYLLFVIHWKAGGATEALVNTGLFSTADRASELLHVELKLKREWSKVASLGLEVEPANPGPVWTGTVAGLDEPPADRTGLDLSMDKASQRACLAKWISVWSLLSHWPFEIECEVAAFDSLTEIVSPPETTALAAPKQP
nr:hypothetical protein Iba_chr03cCG8400 [Ipomoea batatas]